MILYNALLLLHLFAAVLLLGFVFVDRLFLRPVLGREAEPVYRKARLPLLLAAGTAAASGGAMVSLVPALIAVPLFPWKVAAALLFLFLFFGCPRFLPGLSAPFRPFYRHLVTVSAVATLGLGALF